MKNKIFFSLAILLSNQETEASSNYYFTPNIFESDMTGIGYPYKFFKNTDNIQPVIVEKPVEQAKPKTPVKKTRVRALVEDKENNSSQNTAKLLLKAKTVTSEAKNIFAPDRELAITKQLAEEQAKANNIQKKLLKTQKMLADEQAMRKSDVEKIATLEKQIMDLKNHMAEHGSTIEFSATGTIQNPISLAKTFTESFSASTPEERAAQFDAALQLIAKRQDQKAVTILVESLHSTISTTRRYLTCNRHLSSDVLMQYINEHCPAYNEVQGYLHRIFKTDGLEDFEYNYNKKIEQDYLELDRQDDKSSFEIVIANLDEQLKISQINLVNAQRLGPAPLEDLKGKKIVENDEQKAERKIRAGDMKVPVLLYFLKINYDDLMGKKTFHMNEWKHWPSLIPYLTMEQRRALRFYMQKGNVLEMLNNATPANAAIKNFLSELSASIDNNIKTKPSMGPGDREAFNKNLLTPLKRLLNDHPT